MSPDFFEVPKKRKSFRREWLVASGHTKERAEQILSICRKDNDKAEYELRFMVVGISNETVPKRSRPTKLERKFYPARTRLNGELVHKIKTLSHRFFKGNESETLRAGLLALWREKMK